MKKIDELADVLIKYTQKNANRNDLDVLLWDKFDQMGPNLKTVINKIKLMRNTDVTKAEACKVINDAFVHWRKFNSYKTEK